jgi:proteasome lid subunit RPN8/RPN11
MPRVKARPAIYSFRLEFWKNKEGRIHELQLAPGDFSRAVEAAFFDGLRKGAFTDYDFRAEQARIEPKFVQPGGGSPRVQSFEVVLPTLAGGEHRLAFERDYFHNLVARTGKELILAGKVPEDGVILYQLAAYLDEGEKPWTGGLEIELESETPEIPVRTGSRKALGPSEAWDGPEPDDFPVLIPRHVIEEAVEEAKGAPEREVGGVLLGHLRRDETGELYLEVTALVPAEETEATELSVTFTHATWARVREVIAVRGEGEIFVGWMHSHPFRFCAECTLPVQKECLDKVLFYSADDEFLMELSFARPFMVGLLAAVEPLVETALGHAPVQLYGWNKGQIEARGFEVIDS